MKVLLIRETSSRRFTTLTMHDLDERDRRDVLAHRQSVVYSTDYATVDLSRLRLSKTQSEMVYLPNRELFIGE